MLNLKNFGEYLKHYRTNAATPLTYSQLGERLKVSCSFITNVENKGKQFSDKKLEELSNYLGLNEIEFAELIIQRAIDQYTEKKGKKTLGNIKKLLPYYKKIIEGEINNEEINKLNEPDPIIEIKKYINKINNEKLRDFLLADLDYAEKKYSD